MNSAIKKLLFAAFLYAFTSISVFGLSLSQAYKEIEFEPVCIRGLDHPVHLYPTEKIKKYYDNYKKSASNYSSFADYINKNIKKDDIDIKNDTTVYWPSNFVKSHNLASLNSNKKLVVDGNELKDGEYIFVIDKNNNLFMAKKIETDNGRIQHSSLAAGAPVESAGTLDIKSSVDAPTIYTMRNYSGHYAPAPQDIDIALRWLEAQMGPIKISSDSTRQRSNIFSRQVVFIVPK